MKSPYLILAIETSCDETSAAITADDQILSNIVSSQVKYHKKYGGVVPHLAREWHQKLIDPVIKKALKEAKKDWPGIDAISVVYGPGLAPALEVGITKSKELAKKYKKPLIAVNHMEAHLLSAFANNQKLKTKDQFPTLGLLVSGGHTQLVLMKDFGKYQLLGETLDDAAGEAFDKVAKMLGLEYPGGPIISELAQRGKPTYDLPIPMKQSKDLNFSFSGLKTACLYKIQKKKPNIPNFCASFEKAVTQALAIKFEKAIEEYQPKQAVLGGGVINNQTIQKTMKKIGEKYGIKIFIPKDRKLLTDNAGMVGVCAWYQAKRNYFVKNINQLDRQPSLGW